MAVWVGPSVGSGSVVRPVWTRAATSAACNASFARVSHSARIALISLGPSLKSSSFWIFFPSFPCSSRLRVGKTMCAWWLRASLRRSGRWTAHAVTVP